ncbi:MAG: hypothetical protein ABH871_09550 [Pseudomonadota bacterium]
MITGFTFLAACGGSSSSGGGTGDTPTFTSLSDLPKATSPMASAAAQVVADVSKAATTGMNLATTTADFFSADSSRGACEVFNLVKEGISSAAQADMILCFTSYMNSQDSFQGLTDANGSAIDIYDGEWHIFNLSIESDNGAPDRVKMRISKNDAGSITSFEMFMCSLVNNTLVQNEYTGQTISGASLSMRGLGQFTDANGSGWHSVDVTGTLNADGYFTEKVIAVRNKGNWGGGMGWEEGTLTQTPGSFHFSGYRAGSWNENGDSGTHQEAGYSLGEMLGDTSTNIAQLAMGDGAVKYSSQGTYNNEYGQGTYGPDTGVDAWLGDTGLPVDPVTDSLFYNTASDGDLPTVQTTEIAFAFAANETWDCTDDVGVGIVDLPASSQANMDAACSAYMFNHNWINCWEIIEQQQPQ